LRKLIIMPKTNLKTISRSRTLHAIQDEVSEEIASESRRSLLGNMAGIYQFMPFWMMRILPFIRQDIDATIRGQKQQESEETASEEVAAETSELLIDRSPSEGYGFPALLKDKAEILGHRGRYRVTRFLGQRGRGRLYEGLHLSTQQTVIIKEYLLPGQSFNPDETRLIKQAFENLAGIKLADGRAQDFRLVQPQDAISDRHEERCYAISSPINAYPALRTYLAKQGKMSPQAVRFLLNQVLQSLTALHEQKFALPTGQIQSGIAHGNLNLDSLLILPETADLYESPQFLIYLCDVSLWESLFIPPPVSIPSPTYHHDLIALGRVAFYLLLGREQDDQGRLLEPRQDRHWLREDLALEQFIRQLLGLDTPFESAAIARQALLYLPALPASVQAPSSSSEVQTLSKPSRQYWRWLLLTLFLVVLGGGITYWWLRQSASEATEPTPCCIADVPSVPTGRFQYTFGRQSIWHYIWREKNLIAKDTSLESLVLKQLTQLELIYKPTTTQQQAIAAVRSGKAEFAIMASQPETSDDLAQEVVAYDGLVVFVAFTYRERAKGLPRFLNSQISLAQLRQLYSGQVTNWQQIGGPDLPVRLYIPDNPEAVAVFEQKVLQTSTAIEQFRSFNNNSAEIETLPTFELLRRIIQDFEDRQLGGIGFGSLSQVFGQCSVYPLAIRAEGNSPIQPLSVHGRPITPEIDLCNDKGTYSPNMQVFHQQLYPLMYPITIAYPRDNSRSPIGKKLAEILKTSESQKLLYKTGLVPLHPIEETIR
jgi:PBP superfamily domain